MPRHIPATAAIFTCVLLLPYCGAVRESVKDDGEDSEVAPSANVGAQFGAQSAGASAAVGLILRQDSALQTFAGAAANATANASIICFGLCIAAIVIGSLAGAGVIGSGAAVAASLTMDAYGVAGHAHLKKLGVTHQMLGTVVSQAAEFGLWDMGIGDAPHIAKMSQEDKKMHRKAVVTLDYMNPSVLTQISAACSASITPMGLGDSASSSKSGAMFWVCSKEVTGASAPPIIVKGGVRETEASPEWPTFKALAAGGLGSHMAGETLLGQTLFGFDAYDLHWIAMHDVSAEPLVNRLKSAGVIPSGAAVSVEKYDIKPSGSRAPQLPPCFHHLETLAQEMGPIHLFHGWTAMKRALLRDLLFLGKHNVIDESLFVQVVGPFEVGSTTLDEATVSILKGEKEPKCAVQIKAGKMAMVCVTVLDYVLSLTLVKHVQNTLQSFRWSNYDQKMLKMMDCLGELDKADCEDYRKEAQGEWMGIMNSNFDSQSAEFKAEIKGVEKNFDCCCNTTDTSNEFTMDTPCAWIEYKFFSSCPGSLKKIKFRDGGCIDIESPDWK